MPNIGPMDVSIVDVGCLVGVFGVYLAAVLRGMEDYALVAIGDPRLPGRSTSRTHDFSRRPAARLRLASERTERDMATDKSEPKVGLIFRIGLLVIVLLVSIRALLNTYFDEIASAEVLHNRGESIPQPLIDLRASEDERLKSGALPIDKAMQEMVARGRMAVSPDIMPSASRDFGPMQGWSKLPRDVPPATMAPPAPRASWTPAPLRCRGCRCDCRTRNSPDAGTTPKKPAPKK